MWHGIWNILTNISLFGEVILFVGIFILAVYLSFSSQRHEKLFKILVWGVVILFLNFFSCSYLIGHNFRVLDNGNMVEI
jgi:Mn2+/Fe2+ NRAMP family transporter